MTDRTLKPVAWGVRCSIEGEIYVAKLMRADAQDLADLHGDDLVPLVPAPTDEEIRRIAAEAAFREFNKEWRGGWTQADAEAMARRIAESAIREAVSGGRE